MGEPNETASSEDEKKTPVKKAKRALWWRIVRVVLFVMLVPIALAGAVVGYLHTSSGKARVREIIVKRVGEKMNGTIEIGDLDYSIGGDLKLGRVVLKDTSGSEVVHLGALRIVPSWGDLIHERIVLREISVDDLQVNLVKDANGGSNLKRLFKPLPEPSEAKKPFDKTIVVDKLHIGKVGVAIEQPDGTKVAVTDVGIDGSLSVTPATKKIDLELTKIGASVRIDKGEKALKLAVSDVQTGISAHLDNGKGKVTLHPVSGHVSLTLPGRDPRKFDIALAETSFDLGDGSLEASLGTLLTGIVALGSVQVQGNLANLDGSQKADVVGLHVDAAKVNDLLGKEILATDIDVETHVSGPRDAIALDTTVTTRGGDVGLKGTIGVSDPASPTYDLALTLNDISTSRLLASSMNAPPIDVGHLSLNVKGKGREVGAITTDAKLHIDGVKARGVPVDDVDLDAHIEGDTLTVRSLSVKAVGQEVKLSGTVHIPDKKVDLSVALEGDLGEAVAKLKAAGIPLTANLPRGVVHLRPGDLNVSVKGALDGALVAKVDAPHIAFAGGSIGIDARADLTRHDPPLADGKKVDVDGIDAHINIAGIRLSSLAALKGKKLPDLDGTIGGRIDVTGTPTDPHARLDLAVHAQRADKGGPEIRLGVEGQVDAGRAHITLSGERGDAELLKGDIVLPLHLASDPKGIDLSRPVAISLSIPKTRFADLALLLPPAMLQDKPVPEGDIALDVSLAGTARKPAGTFDVDVHARALPSVTQRVHLVGKIAPSDNGSQVTTATNVWLDEKSDPIALLAVDAKVGGSLIAAGPKPVAWQAALDVKPQSLKTLPVPNEKLKALGGTVELHGDFHGDLNDALGSLKLVAHDLRPAGGGPVDATVTASLDEGTTTLAGDVDLAQSPLLRIAGNLGVAGKGLVASAIAKRPLDPTLDLSVDVPKRALATFSAFKPSLSTLPGDLSAHIAVHGTKSEPVVNAAITVDGFKALSGDASKLAVTLDADKEKVLAQIGFGGGATPADAPIRIEAHVPRPALDSLFKLGGSLPIAASARASAVDLKKVVPAFALDKAKGLGIQGQLDWNMDFASVLDMTLLGPKLRDRHVSGSFSLDKAQVDLPHTKRSYKDVALKLTATDESLRIDTLHASESDLEVKNRSFSLKGNVYWDSFEPTSAEVDISADRWLLFGTKKIGLADAPRGTLSIEAHVASRFDKPIKRITVDIKKLEVLFRDRFEKAHQPEEAHVGDLVFLGDASATGGPPVALGKLPVPEGVLEAEEAKKKAREDAEKLAAAPPPPNAKPEPETGLDVEINIAKGAHLLQSPIDLWPEGSIKLESRKSGRKVRGRLTMDKGELSLGGAFHSLTSGSLTFDEAHPSGWMDLSFAKPMKASALRDISKASGGDAIVIHMFGPISDRRTVLSGAGSPGSLIDLLSMHNVGRQLPYGEPDMPASNTVQFPQDEDVLVLSFLSVNLPHLIFLDRVSAWADPYDAQASYGKLEHYQAEREAAGGKVRLLMTKRPQTTGQSEAEAELDYLFANTPQLLFGAGVAGGSRGGGGPGLFVEWSTKD